MSDKLIEKNIVNEMQNSFLDYAMSVIVARALPDVRDGLKPVQRRILYAMNDLGNYADKPYKKSARIVGDVIGKYHPHGDSSVYFAMVRMAQDFSYRIPLVDGHGNFGSIDGDGAAAMRYTEARMSKIAMELLRDIKKETIDFQENYDGTEKEPVVLPAKFPNLLINGASGIAVGMATNIPPHNLSEIIDALIALINNKDISIEALFEIIKGPDFPLGGKILGRSGIYKAYKTGHGKIKVSSKYEIVGDEKHQSIIVSEIPYQVNKAVLVSKIAECVKNKTVEGIRDLRDESDKDGIRIVIDLKQNANPQVVVNGLLKNTELEKTITINMLALRKGIPEVLNIKEILEAYLEHQLEVLVRGLNYDLKKAQERAHLLAGLLIAVNNIDAIVAIIRYSETQEEAQNKLISEYNLTLVQAKAILEMQLKRLTGLEHKKLADELTQLETEITKMLAILNDQNALNNCIVEDLTNIKLKYNTKRQTEIIEGNFDNEIEDEDLIEESDIFITLTKEGYIKRLFADQYKTQNRGGVGIKAMSTNDNDEVNHILATTTHTDILYFSKLGKVYKTRAHKIPQASRQSKGIPLINIIDIDQTDIITNIIAVNDYNSGYLVIVTKKGLIKKTPLSEYLRINKNGKRAVSLDEDDCISAVFLVNENDNIIAATKFGKAIHIETKTIRPSGRSAKGVRLIKLNNDDEVINTCISKANDIIFTLTAKGFGKATLIDEFRIQNRGGKGIKNIKTTTKNGYVVSFKAIDKDTLAAHDLLILTNEGKMIRIDCNEIKISGRNTQGIRMIRLKDEDSVCQCEIVEKLIEENENNASEE